MLDTVNEEKQQTGRKVRTVFMLEPESRIALEKISERTGAPESELLRRAVKQYLSGVERKPESEAVNV